MAKAQLCPVCQGEGKYKGKKCHGCDGRGWVQVREREPIAWPVQEPIRYSPSQEWQSDTQN